MIKRIYISPYSLSEQRSGVLLQIDFQGGKTGFSDLHPWPEFGDLPLAQHIASLRSGIHTNLAAQAIQIAIIDASGRASKINLARTVSIPASYAMCSLDEEPPFSDVKIKFSPSDDPSKLKNFSHCTVRLDFNSKGSKELAEACKEVLGEALFYIEDPFPYDGEEWGRLGKKVKLAADFEKGEADFIVHKVPRDGLKIAKSAILTSYLGHPLEQATSALLAGIAKISHPCGLLGHTLYPPNAYSKQLSSGPEWSAPRGTGLGFDDLLMSESWQRLL